MSDKNTKGMSKRISVQEASDIVSKLRAQVGSAIFGQDDLVTESLCCLLGGGHILLTGAPGLAKTTLVRVLSASLSLQFSRVQFTPDLLPSDILGSEILNVDSSGKRAFEFSKGAIFTNLLLADEINRASPRTQSALLEAMQERSVTMGGKRFILPQPFLVFATQNPFESEGTFPLPEAQLDRFLMHTLVEYPSLDAERAILEAHVDSNLVGEKISHDIPDYIVEPEALRDVMDCARCILVEHEMVEAISDLIRMTRPEDPTCPPQFKNAVWYGAGPRAGIALITAARSLALLQKSEIVRWSHIRRLAKPVLRHRLRLSAHAARDGMTEDQMIESLLERVLASKSNLALGLDSP